MPGKSPAKTGWRVCRMHGARGGAPEGEHNGNYRHGGSTKEVFAAMAEFRLLKRICRKRSMSQLSDNPLLSPPS